MMKILGLVFSLVLFSTTTFAASVGEHVGPTQAMVCLKQEPAKEIYDLLVKGDRDGARQKAQEAEDCAVIPISFTLEKELIKGTQFSLWRVIANDKNNTALFVIGPASDGSNS